MQMIKKLQRELLRLGSDLKVMIRGVRGDYKTYETDRHLAVGRADLIAAKSAHGGHWLTHKADSIIGTALRHGGAWQEVQIDDCVRIAADFGCEIRRGGFLDIGANIGTHSIFAARAGFSRIICIEPDVANFRLLRVNQILHGVDNLCQNFNVALSDTSGRMAMQRSPMNHGDFRLAPAGGARDDERHGESGWDTDTVEIATFDDLAAKAALDVNSLGLGWIDTQGHEGQVLAGAPSLVAAKTPLVVEFWPYGLKRSGGYRKLREQLSACRQIIDLDPRHGRQLIDLEAIDAMYDAFLQQEKDQQSRHTDLLLLK